jgi:hypothetical protein
MNTPNPKPEGNESPDEFDGISDGIEDQREKGPKPARGIKASALPPGFCMAPELNPSSRPSQDPKVNFSKGPKPNRSQCTNHHIFGAVLQFFGNYPDIPGFGQKPCLIYNHLLESLCPLE